MRRALSRAVAAYRVLALGYVAVLIAHDHHGYHRPTLGWLLLGVMAVWTVIIVFGYELLPRWPWSLLAADVAVAAGMVLATLAVQTRANIDHGAATLPAAWVAAPVFAVAVAAGPIPGGVAGAAVSIADVIERGTITHHTFNGLVLLMLSGTLGGYVVRLGERAEMAIASATQATAAAAERERLAREIHDSTLQVLALVARRGAEIGGPTADLAGLAAEQEVALRALVTGPDAVSVDGARDLRAVLSPLASSIVTLSAPADPVLLDADVVHAVAGAVREALANVDKHAGPAARAWVLVEDDGTTVTTTVRDDGAGIAPDRLGAAAADGRLGVAQSIVGRVAAIGGSATVRSAEGDGTEVEISVSR
jgi:signal transduction histidine kinase